MLDFGSGRIRMKFLLCFRVRSSALPCGVCYSLKDLLFIHTSIYLQGRPCFFTVFVSSDITLHPTDHTKADGLIERHLGGLLNPPATIERYNAIGPYTTQDVEVRSCLA